MSRPIVFVDTNAIDNKSSATTFLGGRDEIEKIAKRARVILPNVVRDELRKHILSYLDTQINALRRNPHRHHLKIEDAHIDALDTKKMLDQIEEDEAIKFEVLDLKNKNKAYKEAYDHAINGTPPFEQSGDKGFKDTLIAKTIDEYIAKETGETLFLLCKDGRLAEYFIGNEYITVIKSYEDFDREYTLDRLDEYLIRRVQDFLAENIDISLEITLVDQWLNWDGELIGRFSSPGEKYVVRIDVENREPIDYRVDNIDETLANLADTPNFSAAHDNTTELSNILYFLGIDHVRAAHRALIENDQIYSIGQDDDILQVVGDFTNLLEGFSLSNELNQIRKQYKLSEAVRSEDDYNAYLDAMADYMAEMQSDIDRGH